ncbi:MAG: hypothetical protein PHE26_12165 [Syntrophomonadaceae bacterium]|nr:hypothetical protein [Syntrophomonadaceae bacterium]
MPQGVKSDFGEVMLLQQSLKIREQQGMKGYANGFEGLINYINDQLPTNEEIGRAFRREVKMYPELAIRELVANALIHQDHG